MRRVLETGGDFRLIMRDDPEDYPPGPRVAKIAERNLRTVDVVVERVLPRIQ